MGEKILYICTCGEKDTEKAHLPFVLANAALAMDIQATIVLQEDGVYIAKKGYAEAMPPGGAFPPMKELLDAFFEQGGQLKVCNPCIKARNIAESDLLDKAEVTAAAALNLEAIEADAVFTY